MTLIEDVRTSFDEAQETADTGKGPVTILREGDEELAPGFNGMRAYYEQRLLAVTRRGYRHHAGSNMPSRSDDLIELTAVQMLPLLVGLEVQSFADGVLIGHREDTQVKLSFHFHAVEHLFSDENFRSSSKKLAEGFAEDREVVDWFAEFITGGVDHLTHITGFAHRKVDSAKVWDVWMLIGTACVCSCYLAGHRMGSSWRERDVLSGIEIASEEVPGGPEGKDD